jgi:HAD superfamily hydrolase (TIGR01549 family)
MIADLRAILFDVDDTLFDRQGAQLGVLDVVLRECGEAFVGIDKRTITEAFLESDRVTTWQYYGEVYTVEGIRLRRQRVFLELLGLNAAYAEELSEVYIEWYPRMDAPIEGAKSVVAALAQQLPLGIVSNGLPDVQYAKLETLSIRHLFDCIVLSEELGIRKPDPQIFWHAVELLGVAPEGCLYIGDSYANDVVGARRAGMRVCWFNPGSEAVQGEVEPDVEVRELEEILRL